LRCNALAFYSYSEHTAPTAEVVTIFSKLENILVREPEGEISLDSDRRMVLKWSLKKYDMTM
jgi:hypothetical protein